MKDTLVPNTCQSFVEIIYDFVLNLVNDQMSGPSLMKQQPPPPPHLCHSFKTFLQKKTS